MPREKLITSFVAVFYGSLKAICEFWFRLDEEIVITDGYCVIAAGL